MQLSILNVVKSTLSKSLPFLILLLFSSFINCFSQNLKSCEIQYDETIFTNLSSYLLPKEDLPTNLPIGTALKIHPYLDTSFNSDVSAKIMTSTVEPFRGPSIETPKIYALSFAMKSPNKIDEKLKYQTILAINYKEKQYIYKQGNLYSFTEVNNNNINWFEILDSSFTLNEDPLERFGVNSDMIVPALKNYGIDALMLGGYIINEKLRSINIPSVTGEFKITNKGKNIMLRNTQTNSELVYSSKGNYLITTTEFNKIYERDKAILELNTLLKNKKIAAPNITEVNEFDYIEIDTVKLGTSSYSYQYNLQLNYTGFNANKEKKDSFNLSQYEKFYLKGCYQDSMIAFNNLQNKNDESNAMKQMLLDRLNSMKFKKQLISDGFSEKESDAIINKEIYVGMSEKGIKYGFGLPIKSYQYVWNKIEVIALDYGRKFQVYIKNGKVIGWYREN